MSSLDQMLQARSVAVVGASERAGSVGHQTMQQLVAGGFGGPIHPVNPGYDHIGGLTAYASIDQIGEAVDVAVLAVSNANLEREVERALAAEVGSLVIFASCHGSAADGSSLRQRITKLVKEAGVAVCGGNGMGFVNLEANLRLCGFYQPELTAGGVSFLTHSGSLFSAMLHSRRGFAFNLVVSTGLELNTRMSDYLHWVLNRESTTVVGLFLETVRDPDGFRHALDMAQRMSIPIVALKVGESDRGQAAVATHSEALAGEDAAYEAIFDAFGVSRVRSMDEMLDTIELLNGRRPLFPGGLGSVHDSGGERALLIDTADRLGVPLPSIGETTTAKVAELLDPGLAPENPIDAWGTGRHAEDVFVGCMQALATDPAIGVVAFSVDLTEEEDIAYAYGTAVLDAAASITKPLAVLAHVSTTVDPTQARLIRDGGVPVLQGTETGLRAIGHLITRADRLAWPAPEPPRTRPPESWEDPWDLLAAYGIPFAQTLAADSLDGVAAAASEIGYPVVLKTAAVAHRTDVNGVHLGLTNAEQLGDAYHDLATRLGSGVTISPQIPPGVEIGLGMVTDAQFGPIVVLSAGGTLIELMRDRVALLPPFDTFRATRAIERLAVADYLRGHRGVAPADIDSLAEVVSRFSGLAADCAGIIESIDLNPVIAGPESSVVVDLLVRQTS